MSQPDILEGRTAYVNGDFLPIAEARVSVLDRGFLYGDGLYETLNLANGRTFRLEARLDRLFQSAAVLKITVPLSRDALRDAIFATVEGTRSPMRTSASCSAGARATRSSTPAPRSGPRRS